MGKLTFHRVKAKPPLVTVHCDPGIPQDSLAAIEASASALHKAMKVPSHLLHPEPYIKPLPKADFTLPPTYGSVIKVETPTVADCLDALLDHGFTVTAHQSDNLAQAVTTLEIRMTMTVTQECLLFGHKNMPIFQALDWVKAKKS